ncbi:MAG: hypothetical protein U0411_05915 [Thermodesulfovibrionales bacterium]
MTFRVDALFFLLLIELSLVLLGAAVFSFVRGRRVKRLYRKALGELEGRGEEPKPAPHPPEAADSPSEQEEAGTHQPERVPVQETAIMPEQETSGAAEGDGAPAGPQGDIGTLQRVVAYQKGRILDLMCYKDLFESAQKKLSSIRQKYQELQEKIDGLIASPEEDREAFAVLAGVLQDNNQELAAYIGVLSGENASLSEKFGRWEEELNRLWEEAEALSGADADAGTGAGTAGSFDEGKYEEVLREKEELVDKVRDFEKKLEEKNGLLEEVQKQYEDIEKEYMVLYNQQQAAQQS